MLLYSIIILFSMCVIAVLNIIFNHYDVWYSYIIWTILLVIAIIAIDGLVAFLIRKMPDKYFNFEKKMFNASKKRLKLYDKLKVKKWKEYVPELGGFTDFHKNKIVDPTNNEYIGRFLLEASYGVAIHIFSAPIGFIILLLDYRMYTGGSNIFLTIGLPVAIVNAILIYIPAIILKYNIAKLKRIYYLNKRR